MLSPSASYYGRENWMSTLEEPPYGKTHGGIHARDIYCYSDYVKKWDY
jgi:hypothetical protein